MQEDKKKYREVANLRHMFATLAIILLVLAGALTYLTNAVDVDQITQPFNMLSEDAKKDLNGTPGGEEINGTLQEIMKKNEEQNRNVTGIKKDAEQSATEGSQKKGPIGLIHKAQLYYIRFKLTIEKMENYIARIPYKPLIVLALLFLFFLKGFVSITPISFTCFLSGVIFPFWFAMIINVVGMVYIFSIKYRKGRKSKKNTIHKYVTRWERLGTLIEDSERGEGKGNPWLLFLFRLAPSIPINTISTLYGYMGFRYSWYLVLSLLGYSIKLITFTSIGANIEDPFSAKFVVPILVILYMSGIAMAVLATVYKVKGNLLAEPVETY